VKGCDLPYLFIVPLSVLLAAAFLAVVTVLIFGSVFRTVFFSSPIEYTIWPRWFLFRHRGI